MGGLYVGGGGGVAFKRKGYFFCVLAVVCKLMQQYASAIMEQKKYWELLAEKFDRFQTLRM